METDILTIKEKEPFLQEVFKIIGDKKIFWKSIDSHINEVYGIEGCLKLIGKKWAYWYRKGGKTFVTFYPGENELKVQIVLGKKELEKAENMKFCSKVQSIYDSAKQYHDGKWIFIDVDSNTDIDDIKLLLSAKRCPVKIKT